MIFSKFFKNYFFKSSYNFENIFIRIYKNYNELVIYDPILKLIIYIYTLFYLLNVNLKI